jgi:hypothetical protein
VLVLVQVWPWCQRGILPAEIRELMDITTALVMLDDATLGEILTETRCTDDGQEKQKLGR